MAFYEIQFPVSISYHSGGGPRYSTAIVSTKAGYEKRNINWEYPLHVYDAAIGVRELSDLEDLIAFFHAMQGRAHGFRWKDWADYKSCKTKDTVSYNDQVIGTGDGSTTEFQLKKTYQVSSASLERIINKPVSGTVRIAFDGTEQTSGWSVDTTTGIVTFTSAPASGVQITAGFEFDVPCRFDTDILDTRIESYQLGSAQVPIVEIRI